MFKSLTSSVIIDGETINLPFMHRYVLIDRKGLVISFDGRPELLDEEYNIWGVRKLNQNDLGTVLGWFGGEFQPRLLKFAERNQKIKNGSTGWVVKTL